MVVLKPHRDFFVATPNFDESRNSVYLGGDRLAEDEYQLAGGASLGPVHAGFSFCECGEWRLELSSNAKRANFQLMLGDYWPAADGPERSWHIERMRGPGWGRIEFALGGVELGFGLRF
jgi:hypothetical protein